MSAPPAFFYLDPALTGLNTEYLPIDAEFECVYAPEQTTGDGWVIVLFRVVMAESIHKAHHGKLLRGVEQLSKTPITEDEEAALYEQTLKTFA